MESNKNKFGIMNSELVKAVKRQNEWKESIKLQKEAFNSLAGVINTFKKQSEIYNLFEPQLAAINALKMQSKTINSFESQFQVLNTVNIKSNALAECARSSKMFKERIDYLGTGLTSIFKEFNISTNKISGLLQNSINDIVLKSEIDASLLSSRMYEFSSLMDTLAYNKSGTSNPIKEFITKSTADISDADKKVVLAAVEETIEDSKNWQQKFMQKIEHYEQRNPIVSSALKCILSFIFAVLINIISSKLITDEDANLKTEPTSSATVIVHVKAEQVVYVIDSVPYYHFVEFTDTETRETFKGYISKRSLRRIDEND